MKRDIYRLVGLLLVISVVILVVIDWQYTKNNRMDELTNNYHPLMSEKGYALLNLINETRLWFQYYDIGKRSESSTVDNKLPRYDVPSDLTRRDKTKALVYQVNEIIKEINVLQKQYGSSEFKNTYATLQKVHQSVLADFSQIQSTKSYSIQQIDAMVKPLIAISHQLQRLHQQAYLQKRKEVAGLKKKNRILLISLISLLICIAWLGVIKMIYQFMKTWKALLLSQNDLQTARDYSNSLIDTAPVIVLLLEPDGRIMHVNRCFETVSGYQLEEIKGKDWTNIFVPLGDQERIRELMQCTLQEKPVNGNVYIIVTRDGYKRQVEWYGRTLYDKDGCITGGLFIGQDVTDRNQVEHELLQFRSTLDQTLDCVFMFDASSLYFTYVNEGAIQQVGYTRDELLAMHPYDITPDIPELEFHKLIAPLLSYELTSISFETVHQHKNGQCVPVEIVLQYIHSKNEQPRFVAIVRDITERKHIESKLNIYQNHLEDLVLERTAEMRTARDEAERANAAKSEFLSSISHELRTPMNAVLGFSQLLVSDKEDPLSEDQLESVKYIIEGGQHLLELIDGLLNLSQIEKGHAEVNLQLIDGQELIAQVCSLIQPQATKQSITIENKATDVLALEIQADYKKLKQVLLNFASNAVKYNSEKGVITFACNKTEKGKVRLSVSDTGGGIAADSLSSAFEPFNRLDKTNSNIQGTGIGLAICKELVELMGGVIGAFPNSPDKGMTFWVEFDQA